jgi:hypothetical protein
MVRRASAVHADHRPLTGRQLLTVLPWPSRRRNSRRPLQSRWPPASSTGCFRKFNPFRELTIQLRNFPVGNMFERPLTEAFMPAR